MVFVCFLKAIRKEKALNASAGSFTDGAKFENIVNLIATDLKWQRHSQVTFLRRSEAQGRIDGHSFRNPGPILCWGCVSHRSNTGSD